MKLQHYLGGLEGLPEPLRRPEGLALADGALYVSDRLRHRILVWLGLGSGRGLG